MDISSYPASGETDTCEQLFRIWVNFFMLTEATAGNQIASA
jgi:hypothetical protein